MDWHRHRLRVPSPKTAHHDGHAERMIPLFPEIEETLREVFEQAEPGEVLVLPFVSRVAGSALRKPMEKAIRAAGLEVWPKMFHNLRASRQAELAAQHPGHVVSAWLGNTEKVAAEHYLSVRDEDFDKALAKVVRNPVRQVDTMPAKPIRAHHLKTPLSAT